MIRPVRTLRARGHALAAVAPKARAAGFAADLGPQVTELAAAGRSLRAIAAELNDRGYETRRGKRRGVGAQGARRATGGHGGH